MKKMLIGTALLAAAVLAIVRPNIPRLSLEAIGAVRRAFGTVDSDLHVAQHDTAIARAAAHRDSAKAIAQLLDTGVVRPALHRDSTARQALRRVLAVDSTVPLDVDSMKAALHVTAAAAARLDTTSTQTIGGLLALVSATTARADATDALVSVTQTALEEERRDRTRERWVYRAKIAGGVLAGVILGAIARSF